MLANPVARGKIIQPLSRLLALSPPSAEPQKLAASAEPDLLAAGGGWRWRGISSPMEEGHISASFYDVVHPQLPLCFSLARVKVRLRLKTLLKCASCLNLAFIMQFHKVLY